MPHAILLLLLTGLIFAAPAAAQRAGKSELYIAPVFTNSQSFAFEGGSSAQTDTGTGFTLGFAHNLDAHYSLGGEVAWSSIGYRATLLPALGTAGAPVRIDGTIETSTVRFFGAYNLATGDLTPFLAFGAGWTYVDTGIPSGLPQNGCWYYPWWYGPVCGTYQPTHTTTRFSYNAALGLRKDFGNQFTLRGMVSQQWLDLGGYGQSAWTQWRIDFGTRF